MFFYNLGIHLYYIAIRAAALFNNKASLWIEGRKNWRDDLGRQIDSVKGRPIVWVHCASLGEFEQGRPIIEAIKEQHTQYAIVLTFFSPSGYEVRKDYELADVVCYLPLDTKTNAADFIKIVQPKIALFVKYEFWVNFLNQLKKSMIDTYIIAAVFKKHQPFFKWYGAMFRRSLQAFTTLFVQDEDSVKALASIGINNVLVCGDTRFDRVMAVKNNFEPIPEIEQFKSSSKLIIAGSTWPRDEDMVLDTYVKLKQQNIKLIIVPHDIEDKLLKATLAKLRKHGISYTLFSEGIDPQANVLVLNTIGLLSRLYCYADVSYIGGGFNGGIHNCLEAAVYGRPITFFGKDFVKYNEAVELVRLGAAANVSDSEELLKAWQLFLTDEELLMDILNKTRGYFLQNADATQTVLKGINF